MDIPFHYLDSSFHQHFTTFHMENKLRRDIKRYFSKPKNQQYVQKTNWI